MHAMALSHVLSLVPRAASNISHTVRGQLAGDEHTGGPSRNVWRHMKHLMLLRSRRSVSLGKCGCYFSS